MGSYLKNKNKQANKKKSHILPVYYDEPLSIGFNF